MSWTPDPDALRGRVAVVTGAMRGAGRGIAALASDPDRARWNQRSVTSGQLAKEYDYYR